MVDDVVDQRARLYSHALLESDHAERPLCLRVFLFGFHRLRGSEARKSHIYPELSKSQKLLPQGVVRDIPVRVWKDIISPRAGPVKN